MKLFWTASAVLSIGLAALANEPPRFAPIPEMRINEGSVFPSLRISQIVSDPDHSVGDLIWTFGENDRVAVNVVMGRINIRTVDPDWCGETTLRIEVCDPEGACASQEVRLIVLPINDAPFLSIPDQVIPSGEEFAQVLLSDVASDVDHAWSDLSWSVLGNTELDVRIEDGLLTIEPPNEAWTGVEWVVFRVCDPESACATQQVMLGRSKSTLSVTFVGNDGFVFRQGGASVAIDAFFAYDVAAETQTRMTQAEPPFDGLDLILVTHSHYDHFNVELAISQLRANESSILAGPPDVIREIRSLSDIRDDRLVEVDLGPGESATFTIAGIEVEAIDYPHSPTRVPPNLGYRVHLGDAVVLHTGDIVIEAMENGGALHAFANLPVDVALVPWFVLSGVSYSSFTETIAARYLVPMHMAAIEYDYACADVRRQFSNAVCFGAALQERVLPLE